MKHSSKVLIYGFLLSLLFIALCIHFHADKLLYEEQNSSKQALLKQVKNEIFKPKAIIPAAPIKTFNPKEQEELNPSSLIYQIKKEDTIVIDGKLPIMEDNDPFKATLMAHCQTFKCQRQLVYLDEQAYPVWNKFAQVIIEFFHEQNLSNATLSIDTNSRVVISGKLSSDESKLKLIEIIDAYGVSYNVHDKTTVKKPPVEMTEENLSLGSYNTSHLVEKPIEVIEENSTVTIPLATNTDKAKAKEGDSISDIQSKVSELLIAKPICFEYNKARIAPASQKTLDKIVEMLKDIPAISIEVNGYTDASGKRSINRWISKERAKSVKNYLESKGLNPRNIIARGYGETNLLYKDRPYSPLNRRVEIIIKGDK